MNNQNEWETRLKELLIGFALYIGNEEGPDDHQGWIDKFTNFTSNLLAQQKQKDREEVIEEAVSIFSKFKNEPMTGNVVILELKQLES